MSENDPDMEQMESLSYAGAVFDKAIEFLIGKDIDPDLIASALLGGAISLLSQHMEPDSICRVLDHAKSSVLSGEMK